MNAPCASSPTPAGLAPASLGLRAALALLRFGAATFELFLGSLWLAGRVEPLALLAAHAALAGGLLAVAWSLRQRDAGLWVDAALLALTGPLGAIAILWQRGPADHVAARARAAHGSEPDTGPTVADVLDAELLSGRRRRCDPENRLSMMDRVTRGGLADQQFAISMLSLKYRPEMHPVLLAALQSPTPAVRVQAAAVFAKLRERFGAEARRLLAPEAPDGALDGALDDPQARRERAAACRTLARSPFCDGAVAAALDARAAELDGIAPDEAPPLSEPPAEPLVRRVPGEAAMARARRKGRRLIPQSRLRPAEPTHFGGYPAATRNSAALVKLAAWVTIC